MLELLCEQYDYACALTKGHFVPPGFDAVPSCDFYAYLHYENERERFPRDTSGSGAGQHALPGEGVDFDLTVADGYHKTRPRVPEPEPEEPDVRYTINLGLLGPVFDKATDRPLAKGRWYMDVDTQQPPRSFVLPSTPLYHTKGQCGVEDVPLINIPENATTVELVVQNLSPTAHVLHMHGMPFKVINVANYSSWCGLNQSQCFLLPWWGSTVLDKCPKARRQVGDPRNPNIELGGYWGCTYDAQSDRVTQNLKTPLVKDSFQLWQRSWAVLRFRADRPGFWYLYARRGANLTHEPRAAL